MASSITILKRLHRRKRANSRNGTETRRTALESRIWKEGTARFRGSNEMVFTIENQLNLGSCTAHAAVGVIEYFQKRAFGKYLDGSRLFVYKTTRNLMGVKGDTGARLRNTMAALTLFGVPPEKYHPYTDRKTLGQAGEPTFDEEPSNFVYALAENFEALKYFCHDPQGMNVPPKDVLFSVKKYLAAGIPSMFGFFGFPSFNDTDIKGGIPFPDLGEKAVWGHAVVAVGYDDNKKIKNTRSNKETTGALLIRNSWGTNWGEQGYGWLPYDYVLHKLDMPDNNGMYRVRYANIAETAQDNNFLQKLFL